MTRSPWYQFDGFDFDGDDARDQQIEAHERTALEAIRALADFGEANSDKGLIVGAALRKIVTVAESRKQSLHLRSITVRKALSK